MYYINKIATWVLSPLGILFLGSAVSYLLKSIAVRREKKVKILKTVAVSISAFVLALIWILGCEITTRWLGLPMCCRVVGYGNHGN